MNDPSADRGVSYSPQVINDQCPYQNGKEKIPEYEIEEMNSLFLFTQIVSLHGKESYVGIYHEDSADQAQQQNLEGRQIIRQVYFEILSYVTNFFYLTGRNQI